MGSDPHGTSGTMEPLFQAIINLFEGINTFDELIKKLLEYKIINTVTDYKDIYKDGEGNPVAVLKAP